MWFSEWSVPIVLKGCHRQTYSNISNIWQANSNFQIFPDIFRYFQIFPDISRYFPYSTRVVFAEGAERWALAQRHPTVVRHLLSGTWSRMGLKRYALGQKPVRLTWTYATFCIRLAEFAAEFAAECFTLHSFNMFQYVSICFYMFQLTSETLSANSSVKTAVNTMQTGSLISGFLHCQIQQVEPKNINWFKRFSERIT